MVVYEVLIIVAKQYIKSNKTFITIWISGTSNIFKK